MNDYYLVARIRAAANKLADGNMIEKVISDSFHMLADEIENESAAEDMRRGYGRPLTPTPGRVWDHKTETYGPYTRPDSPQQKENT